MAGKKTILVLFIVMIMSALSLAGCGGSSPTAAGGGGGGNTGPATGGGTISGFIYSLIDQKQPNLSVALASATVVADASTTLSAANGSYTISGLGGTATISAANTGYIAQTLAGVPTTSGQNVHLNPLRPAPAAVASTSISGTVTTTIAGVTTPGSGAVVACYDTTGNIMGVGIANASGAYTMTVNFSNGVTSGNVTLMSAMVNVINSNQIGRFGYVSVNNLTVGIPATAPVLDRTAVTTTAMTINTTNAPAGATTGRIALIMKLPTGVAVEVSGTPFGGVPPTTLTAYAPNVPGVTFNAYASYNDFNGMSQTLSATAFKANIPIAATTLNLLNIPTLTSPTALAAASPAAFTWNAVPGAAQYTVWLSQYAATGAQTYGWGGTTNLTSITKPLFAPANSGNLITGGIYNGELSVSDAVIVGPTTNTTTAINPMIQGLSQSTVSGQLNGYVVNNPTIGANLSSAQSSAFFTVTAN